MPKKSGAVVLLAALIAVLAFTFGVARVWMRYASPSVSHRLYTGSITIGVETWPGYIAFFIARDLGYFKDAGLDVTIKRYPGLGQLSKDYVASEMQGRANLTSDALNEKLHGLDHKIVLAIDYSSGSDAIVARKGVDSVADFEGKRVGYEPETLEEFFVSWALRENGLSLPDVIFVYGTPEETLQMLKDGKIDVAVSHEPYLSRFVGEGNFHVVVSSADYPGLITDVLTFKTDFIEAHPETVQALVGAYFKALDFWKAHPAEGVEILAREFGDSPENISAQMKGITMLDGADNKAAFTFAAGLQSLYGNMRQVGEFVRLHQNAKLESVDTDSLIDRRFIAETIE